MYEQEIHVATSAGTMTTFVAHPDGEGPFPVAVLFMDGVGYREQIKKNTRRFAAGGYYCVAPDLFHRSGEKVTFDVSRLRTDEEYRKLLWSTIARVTPDAAVADTQAVFDAIANDTAASGGPKVCVGYCMGARLALHAAAAMNEQFVAAACIHPGVLITDQPDSPHHDLAEVQGELYFALGENDHTDEDAGRLRQELERQGVRGVVERFPASHGFAMADLPVYDRDAAERHFERTLELWRRNLSLSSIGT
jgi:carboxymethylenebutenolidase